MDVEKLFSGIAVIIDDEIDDKGSSIFAMKKNIEKRNIPVVAYATIPKKEVIRSFADTSFIILDWDFSLGLKQGLGEAIEIGDAMRTEQERELIEFIERLMSDVVVPVFIFTAQRTEGVMKRLHEANLWNDGKPNRIFIKQKVGVASENELFRAIEDWAKSMPSAYVLKEWGKVLSDAKRDMFLRMYKCSPDWARIIWDTLKKDSEPDCCHAFGEFMTRNCVNSIDEYSFDESVLVAANSSPPADLEEVIQGEHYASYDMDKQPERAYTGDLFKQGEKYLLNIRAQCDLAREEDPALYCIEGERLSAITKDIKMTTKGELVLSPTDCFSLDQLGEICRTDGRELKDINYKLRSHRNGIFLHKGEILEKKLEIIVPCVAGEKAIKFGTELETHKFEELKSCRVGRVLPPYITRIQQKCAQTIVREGVMPVPEGIFE